MNVVQDEFSRREMMVVSGAVAAAASFDATSAQAATVAPDTQPVTLTVNGESRMVEIEPRATLLDTLRERLQLFGAKKGCDIGQCGACTVHIDGQRVLSCLTLTIQVEGRSITTIEGVAPSADALHPMQQAFLDHDALQCGYCTPGQIMSGIACVREGHARSEEEIREYMSGNLCRCGAYRGIVAAIRQVAEGQG